MSAPAPPRRSFAATALLTYGANVTAAVLSLVNVLIVARALGPEGRGSVAFLTTVAYLTAQLCTIGVHQANINLASREPGLTGRLATNSLVVALVIGLAAVGVLAALIAVFPAVGAGSDTGLRWMAMAAVPFLILWTYLQHLAIAREGIMTANAAWLLGPVVNVAVNGGVAIAGGLTVGIAVGSWVAGQMLGLALLGWFLVRRLGGFGRPDAALARGMLGFGAKAHLPRLLTLSNYRLDQWLMGSIAGSRALGYYSVAVAWAEALFFLPTALAMVQRPDLARASRQEAGERISPVVRAALLITAVLAVAMIVAAPLLCVTVFGEDFRPSIDQLRILTLGAFGVVVLKLLGNTLVAQGRPMLETAGVGVAFVVILALDVILIPAHEGLGAAIASTVAYTAGGAVLMAICVRHFGLPLRDLLPRPGDVRALTDRLRPAAS
jgi:O-antigen/teichoic acid export membrane protein